MPILGTIASAISGNLTPAWSPSGAYDSLATVTLSTAASTITFSGIPTGYKHLQIIGLARNTSASAGDDDVLMKLNGDTGSNYSIHYFASNGSAAVSANVGTRSDPRAGLSIGGGNTATLFAPTIIDILDYSNVNKYTTFKSMGTTDNNSSGETRLGSGLWQNTTAVTSISLTNSSASNFAINTSYSLYGIK
jgi:hypothetical protein